MSSSSSSTPHSTPFYQHTSSILPPIHRICIIGAGSSGLATFKHFLPFHNNEQFHTIHVYEQRDEIGGVWSYTKETRELGEESIPVNDPWSTSAHQQEEPITIPSDGSKKFISAVYDNLETNIPHPLMSFSNYPFPEGTVLFPPHAEVLGYIRSYGWSIPKLKENLFLNRKVRSVRKDELRKEWAVRVEDIVTGEVEEERRYDAVVVCTGNYNVPYVPDIPGLKDWVKDGHWVKHGRDFRRAEDEKWVGRKIIVVGNSASGVDISYQLVLSGSTKLPLLQSIRKPNSPFDLGFFGQDKIRHVPEIASFTKDHVTGAWLINYKDGSSERDVSGIVFCTGYLRTTSYLDLTNQQKTTYPITPHMPPQSGFRLHNLYNHFLYIPDPTLSFICIPFKVIPFPLAELQSSVLARIYTGLIPILSPPDQTVFQRKAKDGIKEDNDADLIREIMFRQLHELECRPDLSKDAWKPFHCFGYPKDAEYLELMGNWCSQQKEWMIVEGREVRVPRDWTRWGRKERWIRERLREIKMRYAIEKIEKGRMAKEFEELGLKFDESGNES